MLFRLFSFNPKLLFLIEDFLNFALEEQVLVFRLSVSEYLYNIKIIDFIGDHLMLLHLVLLLLRWLLKLRFALLEVELGFNLTRGICTVQLWLIRRIRRQTRVDLEIRFLTLVRHTLVFIYGFIVVDFWY